MGCANQCAQNEPTQAPGTFSVPSQPMSDFPPVLLHEDIQGSALSCWECGAGKGTQGLLGGYETLRAGVSGAEPSWRSLGKCWVG